MRWPGGREAMGQAGARTPHHDRGRGEANSLCLRHFGDPPAWHPSCTQGLTVIEEEEAPMRVKEWMSPSLLRAFVRSLSASGARAASG